MFNETTLFVNCFFRRLCVLFLLCGTVAFYLKSQEGGAKMFSQEKLRFRSIELSIAKKNFREAKDQLTDMEPADIADGLKDLPPAQLVLFFRLLPKDTAIEVFELLDFDEQERFLKHASDEEVREMLEEMSDDDRTELFDELPAGTVNRLLLKLSPEERRVANALLGYPDDSCGRIMTAEYVLLAATMTAKEALASIRSKAYSKETIYTSFVVDSARRLIGSVELEDLILAAPATLVSSIMNEAPVSILTTDDQEEAARIISRWDLHTLPVVDKEKRLVGIITFDDVLDVVEEEATEDFERMAGIEPVDENYLDANIFMIARKRFFWLIVCIVAEALTSTVLKHYSPVLRHTVALTFFIPLLIGTGGNAGTQAATLMIRGMATGEIEWVSIGRILARELGTALLVGGILGAIGLGWAYFQGSGVGVSITVACAVVMVVILGNLAGTLLPLMARAVHFDPAVMAGPFITTVVDVFGLIIYFEIARVAIGG